MKSSGCNAEQAEITAEQIEAVRTAYKVATIV